MINMTSTIFYNGKTYPCEFVNKYSGYHDIYIDRQARLAFLIGRKKEVRAIVKLETYQIDVLLNDEELSKYLDELEKLENKFDDIMYNE